jgi:hypothetical protein
MSISGRAQLAPSQRDRWPFCEAINFAIGKRKNKEQKEGIDLGSQGFDFLPYPPYGQM